MLTTPFSFLAARYSLGNRALRRSTTAALVVSQVVLSFGIPFALVPLLRLTSDTTLMGRFANRPPIRVALIVAVVLVIALNLALVLLALVPSP